MTTPLLEGLDGVEKMSKSLGNYVGVTDPPGEMFGKLMSISDELMWRYYSLLTDLTPEALLAKRAAVSRGEIHPKLAKLELASTIVTDFHGEEAARAAAQEFERRFSKREVPEDVEERPILRGTTIEHLLLEAGLAKSGSDATRKVQQGAVRIDGEKFLQPRSAVDRPGPFLLQVGRQLCRIVLLEPLDVLLTSVSAPDGRQAWMLMQNKGQVDVLHADREGAMARARAVAEASKGRVFEYGNGRVSEQIV
jgi:tyrosyl-tRNA synthetase